MRKWGKGRTKDKGYVDISAVQVDASVRVRNGQLWAHAVLANPGGQARVRTV